jgi:competence protein ComEC
MLRYPLLMPLLALLFGIVLGGFYPFPQVWLLPVFFASLLLLGLVIWKKALQHFSLYFFLFFAVGLLLTSLQDERLSAHHYVHQAATTKQIFKGKLITHPVPTQRAVRLEIELLEQESGRAISGKMYVYAPQEARFLALFPGDQILFSATLNPLEAPKNPHEFDYKNYLNLHGVYAQCYTQEVKVLRQSSRVLARYTAKARGRLLALIGQMNFSAEEIAVASALLLGYRHLVTDETTMAFSGSGAMHVLAVSGLHVGILYMMVSFLLRIDRRKPQQSNAIQVFSTIAIIWAYAALTGFSPSVNRAAVMFTFVSLGYLRQHKTPVVQSLIVSAGVLLAYNPNYLFEVGFQLSYLAVFGIVYLQRDILAYFPKTKFWLVNQVFEICAVSIAAQLGTFPLGMYYFHQFPVYFLVSNLVVIPAAFLAMFYGISLLMYGSIFPLFAWMALPLKWILWCMIESVKFVNELPSAVIGGLWIGRIEMLLLTLFVFLAADALWRKSKTALFAATGLVVILLMSNLQTEATRRGANHLTFYSVKKQPAIEYRQGQKSALLADSTLLADEQAMLFHIRHNLWAGGVEAPKTFSWNKDTTSADLILSNGMADFNGHRVLLYAADDDSTKFVLNPAVIFVVANVQPPQQLPNLPVVLLNGLRPKTVAGWGEKSVALHNLATAGAFTLALPR